MNFEKLKNLCTSWWVTPAVAVISFVVPLLMPNMQLTQSVAHFFYPPERWVGAVSFRLSDVPGYTGSKDIDLILLTHRFDDNSRVTFLRDGGQPELVAAGAPEASLTIDLPKTRTSGTPLFDLDLPPETLVAASIVTPRGAPPSRYTLITAQCTKQLTRADDLIVLPRNEVRKTRITYLLSFVALGLAAVFMPRYAHLSHIENPSDPVQ